MQHGGLYQLLHSSINVSILYEADRLCNYVEKSSLCSANRVSILYEADRLCNPGAHTHDPVQIVVSILYEADRLCNMVNLELSEKEARFQSSTRQTDFATSSWARLPGLQLMFQSSTRQTDFATY